jgi:hypothetical protein
MPCFIGRQLARVLKRLEPLANTFADFAERNANHVVIGLTRGYKRKERTKKWHR